MALNHKMVLENRYNLEHCGTPFRRVSLRLVKMRKSKILIKHDCLEFCMKVKEFWILFVICEKAKCFYKAEFHRGV